MQKSERRRGDKWECDGGVKGSVICLEMCDSPVHERGWSVAAFRKVLATVQSGRRGRRRMVVVSLPKDRGVESRGPRPRMVECAASLPDALRPRSWLGISSKLAPSHHLRAATRTPSGSQQPQRPHVRPGGRGRGLSRPQNEASKQRVFYERLPAIIGSTRGSLLSREAFQGA
jgi:hypothetical protein